MNTTIVCTKIPSIKLPIKNLFSNIPTLKMDFSLFMLKLWTSSNNPILINAIVLPTSTP